MRRLRNAGFSPTELLLYYLSCIRLVLEYTCPSWATSFYEYQKETLESVQKRALAIIIGSFRPISSTIYESQLMQYKLEPLESRRMNLSKSFFTDSLKNTSCINHIMPSQRDSEITMKLRRTNKYPLSAPNTETCRKWLIRWGPKQWQPNAL